MQKKLEIGQIVNTHGIKGEIKVIPFTNAVPPVMSWVLAKALVDFLID